MSFASATASSSRRWYIEAALIQGASAPSVIERVGSGTISSGSITRWKPSPRQVWQQPWGELKEKIRGSSSGIEVPQLRHAKRSREDEHLAALAGGRAREHLGARRLVAVGHGGGALALDELHLDQPLAQLRGGLDRLGEALAQPLLHHQPVDDDRDVVLELLVELDLLLEPAQLAVDDGARVALLAHLGEHPAVLALAAADDRRQDHELRSVGERHHPVDDLLDRLARDRLAAVEAVRVPDPRPEQPQVVVDLGDGADRRARVARGRLLVDRDRRREALDRVDVGLLHLPEELARVGGERLDVAALALGVDRVEGEARLARAREPGDDQQRLPRAG